MKDCDIFLRWNWPVWMEASRAFGTPAASGGACGVAGVSWLGVAAAGRGEGDPKLEIDWWLKGL